MPKLTKDYANKASSAADDWNDGDNDRSPLDPGWYLCRLLDVEQKDGKAAPYWSWKYETVEGERWLWDNTSLSEKAIGRLGKVFEAYGVPADTDTDTLYGRLVNIQVGVEAQATGRNAGTMRNVVLAVMPGDSHPDFQHTKTGYNGPVYGDEEPF